MSKTRYLSIVAAAQLLSCPPGNLLPLYERLLQRPAPRAGRTRVIPTDAMPVLKEALDKGYLPPANLVAHAWPFVYLRPSDI
jgi:hypothetical protein